ncbi:GGDEF domain-containing protein [Pseudoteredinibacter isoporae]|uniref:GGDEF domain-containing protein n=1 Tax=Pseudoteredinibacter isoporae TaxID=570281 RepID=UPI0031070E36
MEDIRFVPNDHGAILKINKHRKQLLYTINLICFFAIVPFAILAFTSGQFWLGSCLLTFVATLAFNTVCVIRRGREFFHYSIVVSFLIAALTLAVHHKGVESVFWVFPVVATSIFVLPMRVALFFSISLTTSVFVLMFLEMSAAIALRASLSLGITIAINCVVVYIIQELQDKLRRVSQEDPLTELSNRRLLDDELATAIEQYKKKNISAVVLLIDVDCFKTINDNFGHDIGDRIIKAIADTIKRNTRSQDMIFRLGGDEFLVLLNGTQWPEAETITENIRMASQKLSEQEDFSVSVSIGASEIHCGVDKSAWMREADMAMYQAKMGGRNCAHLYRRGTQYEL